LCLFWPCPGFHGRKSLDRRFSAVAPSRTTATYCLESIISSFCCRWFSYCSVGPCTLIRFHWNIFDLSHVPVTVDAARVPEILWNDCMWQCGSFRACGARSSCNCRDNKQAKADVSASRGHSARSRQLDGVGDCTASKKGGTRHLGAGRAACASCLCGAESFVSVRQQAPAAWSGPP